LKIQITFGGKRQDVVLEVEEFWEIFFFTNKEIEILAKD
jgi:hypothetical protein